MAQNSRFHVCVIARVSIEIYWFRDGINVTSFVGIYIFINNKLISYQLTESLLVLDIIQINSIYCFQRKRSEVLDFSINSNIYKGKSRINKIAGYMQIPNVERISAFVSQSGFQYFAHRVRLICGLDCWSCQCLTCLLHNYGAQHFSFIWMKLSWSLINLTKRVDRSTKLNWANSVCIWNRIWKTQSRHSFQAFCEFTHFFPEMFPKFLCNFVLKSGLQKGIKTTPSKWDFCCQMQNASPPAIRLLFWKWPRAPPLLFRCFRLDW